MQNILTTKELSQKLGITYNLLYVFLNGYRFTKFIVRKNQKVAYRCNKEFWERLIDYLILKNRLDDIKNIKRYLYNEYKEYKRSKKDE